MPMSPRNAVIYLTPMAIAVGVACLPVGWFVNIEASTISNLTSPFGSPSKKEAEAVDLEKHSQAHPEPIAQRNTLQEKERVDISVLQLISSGITFVDPEANVLKEEAIEIFALDIGERSRLNQALAEIRSDVAAMRRLSGDVNVDGTTLRLSDPENFDELKKGAEHRVRNALDVDSLNRLDAIGLDYLLCSPWLLGLNSVVLAADDQSLATVYYTFEGARFSVKVKNSVAMNMIEGTL